MGLTLIQIQSLIVCGVMILTAVIVGAVAIKWEAEEERERLERIRRRYRR